MSNIGEIIQLYGLDNLPDELRKERELQRWRDIMAQQKYEQDDLPYFQQQDDREAFERRKQALVKRAFAWYRLSKKKDKSRLVDIYNKICLLKKERD